MSFVVKGDFFAKFKIGDNVQYNLSVLEKMYEFFDNPNTQNKELLIKPIIIILISIIEAILYDFHVKVRTNVHEGVPGLDEDTVSDIRNKQFDELGKYIKSSKQHDLFKLEGTSFYDKLEKLRKIRNRVHIQNKWRNKPDDECSVFTSNNKGIAEICLEVVSKTMHYRHPRPLKLRGHVGDLKFPWKEHLKTFRYRSKS